MEIFIDAPAVGGRASPAKPGGHEGGSAAAAAAEFVGVMRREHDENDCHANGRCFDSNGLGILASMAGLHATRAADSVSFEELRAAALRNTGCRSLHCVLDKAAEEGLSRETIDAHKKMLKPLGPAESRDWLSDKHIIETLRRWELQFSGFTGIPYAMMNFADEKYDNEFKNFNPVAALKSGTTAFACVLNTDTFPHGKGKHWVCVFVDMRGSAWSVEYFNSSGRPPVQAMTRWMVLTRNDLRQARQRAGEPPAVDDFVISRRPHQEGNSECGVYCLFYIWCRLNNVPHKLFEALRISDENVAAFRRNLFVQK